MTSPATQAFLYRPDHAAMPGCLIQEYIDSLDISARELARRCGRSAKLITEIILGKAPLEPETAIQLERVLKLDAEIWIGMESQYRLNRARQLEEEDLASSRSWVASFPTSELCARHHISCEAKDAKLAKELLRFFGVGSVAACQTKIEELLVADFRTSPAYANHIESLAAWLRIGELAAEELDPPQFDRDTFRQALNEIRPLTRKPIEEALPAAQKLCAKAGVAFVVEQPLGKIALSGASCWLTPRRALIQQTARYRADDHFWFTFFHECAHLLLHSRKLVFIDVLKGRGSASTAQENEANLWAADFLVPDKAMRNFIRKFEGEEDEILDFADRLDIAPGIIVGQLQHRKIIEFKEMNHLRQRFQWTDAEA